ncbi:MAG: DegV family protein [Clostridiales bacterium]|nr:DegV family protein [Clostridiales bacterium]
MDYKIIVDSSCDLTDEQRELYGIISVPFTMRLGEKEFLDDEGLDYDNYMCEMKLTTQKVGSAAPSPHEFQKAMEVAKNSYVVTISGQLSASYQNAMIAKTHVEETGTARAHVFDSKSASAAEHLTALKIYELMQKKASREQIISTVQQFIDNMKTYFVLERYDNLYKNGRLNKIAGKLLEIINVKLVMGTDGNGNIAHHANARNIKHMIDILLSYIGKSGRKTEEENIVISHCDNLDLAERFSNAVRKMYTFKNIIIVHTGGLSSLYADHKGIVLAF